MNFSSNIVLYTVGMFLSAIPYTVYSPYKVSDQRDGLFREGITPAVLYIIHIVIQAVLDTLCLISNQQTFGLEARGLLT